MLRSPVFWLAFVGAYLLIGVVWAATFGIHRMELDALRERRYEYEIHEVLSAEFNGLNLWLCVAGREMHHPLEPADTSEFELVVPIKALWADVNALRSEGFARAWWGQYAVRLPKRQVLPGCGQPREGFVPLPVASAGASGPLDIDGLERLAAERPLQPEVLVVPADASSGALQVLFLNTTADSTGRRFIDIGIRTQRRKLAVPPADAFRALALDTLTFPYQVIVWARYAGAH